MIVDDDVAVCDWYFRLELQKDHFQLRKEINFQLSVFLF